MSAAPVISIAGRPGYVDPAVMTAEVDQLVLPVLDVRLDCDTDAVFWAEVHIPVGMIPLVARLREILWPAADPDEPWSPDTLDEIADLMIEAGVGPPEEETA